MNERFADHRRRRSELAADPDVVDAALRSGIERATDIADRTLDDVRERMGMRYLPHR